MLDYFRKVCGRGSGAVHFGQGRLGAGQGGSGAGQGGSGAGHFGLAPNVVEHRRGVPPVCCETRLSICLPSPAGTPGEKGWG